MQMADRFFFAVILVLVGVGLYAVAQRVHLRVLGRRLVELGQSVAPGLAAFQSGQPALLYFTTPQCMPCRTVLKPALRRLSAELENRFQVLEVNAQSQPEAARYWRVLSVPTIFVLDPQGKPRHVHYGVVGAEVLRAELSAWLDA
jgi:thioredoxin 1